MVIISLDLTRVNPDRNIFSINVELASTFLPYRGLVHHHYRILNVYSYVSYIAGQKNKLTEKSMGTRGKHKQKIGFFLNKIFFQNQKKN